MVRNVVVVCDYANVSGGAAKIAVSSAIALSKCESVHVYYFASTAPIEEELESSSVTVISLGQYDILENPNRVTAIVQGIWNRRASAEFRRLLLSLDKESTIVHVHGWTKALSSSVINVAISEGYKTFITLHDFFLYCPNGGLYNYQARHICCLPPMSCKCIVSNCDARNYLQKLWRVIRQKVQNNVIYRNRHKLIFISISELSERVIKKYWGEDLNVYRVNNMIDRPHVSLNNGNRNSYVYMARLSPEKGLDLFCEAMTKANKKGLVCGAGYLMDKFKNQYPNIQFTGWVNSSQKSEYLRDVKCCIFPSRCYETFGLSVAEMLSVGIPCIVPEQNAAAELIQDGENGYLFKGGDIDSLTNAIEKFELNQYQFTKESVSSSIDLSKFSLSEHLSQLISLYDQELAKFH